MNNLFDGVVKENKKKMSGKISLLIVMAVSSIGLLFFTPGGIGVKIFILLLNYLVISIVLKILYSGVSLISIVLISILAISSLLFFHIIPYNQQLYDINKLQYLEDQSEINSLMVNIKTRQDNNWLFDIPRFNYEGRQP